MKLNYGSYPVCIAKTPVDDLRLSVEFIREVHDTFRADSLSNPQSARLTHQAIAADVCNTSLSRETVSRIIAGHYDNPYFSPHVSFAIITSILIRPVIQFTTTRHVNRPEVMSTGQRVEILNTLKSYGVSCADGHCCALLQLPKELSREVVKA